MAIVYTSTVVDIQIMTIDIQTVAGVMGNVLEWYDFALYGKNVMFARQFRIQN